MTVRCAPHLAPAARDVLDTIERIRAGLNPELSIEGVVLTMFDERTNLAQQVMTELKNFFGEKLCRTTVPRNIRLAEAPSHGKAALVYDPRSKGAESYIRLAKEIIERQPSARSSQPTAEEAQVAAAGAERLRHQVPRRPRTRILQNQVNLRRASLEP